MSGKMALNKGKRGEREVIKVLQPIVDEVYAKHELEAPILQRNTLQSDRGGFDIVGLEWMALEVKFQEQLSVNTWWKQTLRQARPNQLPVLFYRKSRMKWNVVTTLYYPNAIGAEPVMTEATVSLESFLEYFKRRLEVSVQWEVELAKG